MNPPRNENETEPQSPCGCTKRRSFCKSALAAGIAAAAVAPPVAAGIRTVISATRQKGIAGDFHPLAKLETLGRTPQKFLITAEGVKDGWITNPTKKIGSVYLLLKEGGKEETPGEPLALHTACPHSQCAIDVGNKENPQTGEKELMFFCPCHAAHFDLDGVRLDGVSPRDMDVLETKVENDMVYVKYEDFLSGITEKKSTS